MGQSSELFLSNQGSLCGWLHPTPALLLLLPGAGTPTLVGSPEGGCWAVGSAWLQREGGSHNQSRHQHSWQIRAAPKPARAELTATRQHPSRVLDKGSVG